MRFFEINGRWWLPDAPKGSADGVLTHDKEGLNLRLKGDVEPSREIAWRFIERPVLFGEADGVPMTIFGASNDLISVNQEYHVRETYLGGHFKEAPQFQSFSVGLSDLDSFLGVNPSFAMLRLKDLDETGDLLTVSNNDATIRFVQPISLAESLGDKDKRRRTHVEVRFEAPVTTLSAKRSIVFPLQRLVALGTTENTSIEFFSARENDASQSHQPVEIIFAQRDGLSDGEDKIPDHMLFSRYDLEYPKKTIAAWLALSKVLPHVLHPFFDYSYFRRGDLTGGVVSVVQSLEGLHRDLKKPPSERIPKKDFDELRKRFKEILAATFPDNTDYATWLSDALNPGVSLATRLASLFDTHASVMRHLVADRDEFVNTAKKFRNAFAHGLELDELTAPDQRGLFFLMEKLSVLFRSCLLEEIGLPSDIREVLFRRNQWFKHLTRCPHLEWSAWRARTKTTVSVPE